MDVLGISSNTWLKIKRGEPVRRSIAERLATRFGLQLADALWQQPCVISREEDADRPR